MIEILSYSWYQKRHVPDVDVFLEAGIIPEEVKKLLLARGVSKDFLKKIPPTKRVFEDGNVRIKLFTLPYLSSTLVTSVEGLYLPHPNYACFVRKYGATYDPLKNEYSFQVHISTRDDVEMALTAKKIIDAIEAHGVRETAYAFAMPNPVAVLNTTGKLYRLTKLVDEMLEFALEESVFPIDVSPYAFEYDDSLVACLSCNDCVIVRDGKVTLNGKPVTKNKVISLLKYVPYYVASKVNEWLEKV